MELNWDALLTRKYSLTRYLDEYSVSFVIRQKAPNRNLIQTTISLTKELTENDALLIRP